MRTLATIACFVGRHAVALGIVTCAVSVLWTLAYFALLLWAIVVGGGVGSPVVFPLGIAAIFCGGLILWLLLLFPSTLVGELLCSWRSWPTLLGIPITFAAFVFLSLFWSWIAQMIWSSGQPSVFSNAAVLVLLLAVPLGLYWWSAEFPHVIRDVFRIVSGFRNQKSKVIEPDAGPNRRPAS